MSDETVSVLLLEDNPADARLVREMVRDRPGLHIHHEQRLAAGIQFLTDHKPAAILLDLGFPDSHGLDTLRSVLSTRTDAAVIVLTGNDDELAGQAAIREGAQDYLVKGRVDEYVLARAVRYAIERKRILTKLQEALDHVKRLSGLLPICAGCKKIRDDKGYWNEVAEYISRHSDVQFSHGLCPDCIQRMYPEYAREGEAST